MTRAEYLKTPVGTVIYYANGILTQVMEARKIKKSLPNKAGIFFAEVFASKAGIKYKQGLTLEETHTTWEFAARDFEDRSSTDSSTSSRSRNPRLQAEFEQFAYCTSARECLIAAGFREEFEAEREAKKLGHLGGMSK